MTQDNDALRKLFAAKSRDVYSRALDITQNEDEAKRVLKEVLSLAKSEPDFASKPDNWLFDLCDSVSGVGGVRQIKLDKRPKRIDACVEATQAFHPVRLDGSTKVAKKSAPENALQKAAKVTYANDAPSSFSNSDDDYDLENDEWLMSLKSKNGKKKATQNSQAFQHKKAEPKAVIVTCSPDDGEKPSPIISMLPRTGKIKKRRGADDDLDLPQGDGDDAFLDDDEDDLLTARKGAFGSFLITMLIIAIVVILWVIVGLLMNKGVLPFFDLGYKWFNLNVFDMF